MESHRGSNLRPPTLAVDALTTELRLRTRPAATQHPKYKGAWLDFSLRKLEQLAMAYVVWRCLFAVALLSVLVRNGDSDGGSTGGNDIREFIHFLSASKAYILTYFLVSVRVGFERPKYSVGRGEGSVKVKLVFSAYTGDRSEDDSFDLRVTAEDDTAVGENWFCCMLPAMTLVKEGGRLSDSRAGYIRG